MGGTIAIVVLAIVALTVISGGGNNSNASNGSKPTPSPTDSLAPAKAALLPAGCTNENRPAPGPSKLPSPAPGRYAKPNANYKATIRTNCGDIKVTLDGKAAPQTVNNFVYLADKGFYNGLYWHRIVRNFVIQAGDPNGKAGVPPDDAGYTIKDEFPPRPNEYTFGTLAMGNTGQPNSGGSQFFFIVHEKKTAKGNKRFSEPAGLQPRYSLFGRASKSSFPVLERIAKTPVVGGTGPDQSEPVAPVFITSIDVTSG